MKRLSDFIKIDNDVFSFEILEELKNELTSDIKWQSIYNNDFIIFDDTFISDNVNVRSFLNYKFYKLVHSIVQSEKNIFYKGPDTLKINDYGYFIFKLHNNLNPQNIFDKTLPKSLDLIINLDDDPIKVSFFDNSYDVLLDNNSSILFPSNFMFDYNVSGNGNMFFSTMAF